MFVEMIETTNILNSQNQTPMREAWGIARTSTKEQVDSIEIQKDFIQDYVKIHPELDFKGTEEWHESAFKNSKSETLDFLRHAPKHSSIIFYKVDRMCRNSRQTNELENIVNDRDIEIHIIIMNIIWNKDTDPERVLDIKTELIAAERESRRTSRRVRDVFITKRRKGEVTYHMPFGYISPGDCCWQKDEIAAKAVQKTFEAYSTGQYSIEQMRDIAFGFGVYAPLVFKQTKIKKPMCKQGIINLLTSREYIGFAQYKGEEYEHKYEIFIDKELFLKCQEIYQGKTWTSPTHGKQKISPLNGFIVSEKSGKTFTPYETKGNIYLKSPDKDQKDLKAKDFHNAIIGFLNNISSKEEICKWFEQELNKNNRNEIEKLKNKVQTLKYDIETKNKRVLELIDAPFKNISPEQLDYMIGKLNKDINNYKLELQEKEKALEVQQETSYIKVNNMASVYQCHKREIQEEILHLLFNKILYKDGKATFILKEKPVEMLNQETFVSMI